MAVDAARFGERDGNSAFSVAIAVSVGLNAIVSPILGALSDRGRPAAAVPAVLHGALHRPDGAASAASPAIVGLILFVVANFAYQAALIYYDATLGS